MPPENDCRDVPRRLAMHLIPVEDHKRVLGAIEVIDVAVTIVRVETKLLAVYNDNWGAFTLPMTKRRSRRDPNVKDSVCVEEKWEDAAVRAAAECLGRTITDILPLILEHAEFMQSLRTGEWKRYRVKTFDMPVKDTNVVRKGLVTEWLPANEFLNMDRQPISPTARHIIAELQLKHKLLGNDGR